MAHIDIVPAHTAVEVNVSLDSKGFKDRLVGMLQRMKKSTPDLTYRVYYEDEEGLNRAGTAAGYIADSNKKRVIITFSNPKHTRAFVEETHRYHFCQMSDASVYQDQKDRKKRNTTNPSVDLSGSQKYTPHHPQDRTPKTEAKRFQTQKGETIVVHVGDITKVNVDVIVNAANGRLRHIGGLARAIADAAGSDFAEECRQYLRQHGEIPTTGCVVTGPGNLPCKRVLHVVGPRWSSSDQQQRQCLHDLATAFDNIYTHDSIQQFSSIAIPPVSSGNFGVPIDLVVAEMVRSLRRWCDGKSASFLKEIHFIDTDRSKIELLWRELEREAKNGTWLESEENNKTSDSVDRESHDFREAKLDTARSNQTRSASPERLSQLRGTKSESQNKKMEKTGQLSGAESPRFRQQRGGKSKSFHQVSGTKSKRHDQNKQIKAANSLARGSSTKEDRPAPREGASREYSGNSKSMNTTGVTDAKRKSTPGQGYQNPGNLAATMSHPSHRPQQDKHRASPVAIARAGKGKEGSEAPRGANISRTSTFHSSPPGSSSTLLSLKQGSQYHLGSPKVALTTSQRRHIRPAPSYR